MSFRVSSRGAKAIGWAGASLALVLGLAAPALAAPGLPTPELPPGIKLEEGKRSVNKAGPEVKFVYTDQYSGLLYGGRASRFLTNTIYVGLMAYGDIPLLGRELAPGFGYTGLLTGYEMRLTPYLGLDANLHAGILRNNTSTVFDGWQNMFTIEPSVSVWTPIPWFKGTRVALAAGYLVAPMAQGVSGLTMGLHVDFKSLEVKYDME